MCLLASELPPGPGDALLGEIAGAPFYIDADQDRRWGHPLLLVDVLPGAATSLSLEGAQDLHFIARAHPPDRRDAMTPNHPPRVARTGATIRIRPQRTAAFNGFAMNGRALA